MIYIFHGDHQADSYSAFSENLKQFQNFEKFHQDNHSFDLNSFDHFLNTPSLFSQEKVIILENPFSIPKTIWDKAQKLILSHSEFNYLFWQDKKIEAAKLKIFPKATVKAFALPEVLFSCLNSIRPHNLDDFSKKYQQLIAVIPFELALFWFKNSLRRQLTTYSKFPTPILKKAYLDLIDLDYHSKTGQLFESKEIALERLILALINS